MVLPPPSSIGLFSTMSSRSISPKLSETFVPNFGTATETSVPMGAAGPRGGATSMTTCLDDTKGPRTGACTPPPGKPSGSMLFPCSVTKVGAQAGTSRGLTELT